jgi:O-antigen biosynthesis protein
MQNRFDMQKLPQLLKRTVLKIRKSGWKMTLSQILYKGSVVLEPPQSSAVPMPPLVMPPSELSIAYAIMLNGLQALNAPPPTLQSDLSSSEQLHFAWIVPFFSKGSGGHKNLFRFVKGLEDLGHRCTIYIEAEYELGLSESEIRSLIREYFEPIDAQVKLFDPDRSEKLSSDVVVATSWITAYAALVFSARMKLYFVQDYEPLFFSSGSYWHLAKNTYQFGFYHITLGPWLTSLLRQQHQVEADFYDIVVDKSLYYPRAQISHTTIRKLAQTKHLKICFYGRSVTPRRCFEIVVMALYSFTQEVKDVTIACYGWNEIPPIPFKCTNLGSLEVEDLAELYSGFDICIAPSSTNLALVAHEVMACGCVLMDLEAENTALNLKHLSNSYLVKPDPKAMCDGLLELFHNPQLLADLKRRSLDYAQQLPTWEKQIETFDHLVKKRLNVSQVV